MASLARGDVVLVRFPFSDLTSAKLRPAVVLAPVDRGDQVLCQITSKSYADPKAIEIADNGFSTGGLQRTSYARPGKLFTAHERLIARKVGSLTTEKRDEIVEGVIDLLRADPATPAQGLPSQKGLARAFELLADLPEDFLPEGRRDSLPQEREGLE